MSINSDNVDDMQAAKKAATFVEATPPPIFHYWEALEGPMYVQENIAESNVDDR